MPERIQLRRTKGWRLRDISPNAIVVSRPTKWGNPIRITPERARHVLWYRVHGSPMDLDRGPAYVGLDTARHFAAKHFEWDLLNGRYPNYPSLEEIVAELAGHDLACWCPPRKRNPNGSQGQICCHGDVLLDIAEYWEPASA